MSIRIVICITFFTLLLILNNPASAFKILEPGETVSFDTVIDDDLYICGGNVIVNGMVLGDVLACGGLIEINGNVTGDVMAGAGNVIIDGYVGDDVRVGTGMLIVNGHVGDDLVAGAGNVIISDDAAIEGDVVFSSGQMELRGDVGGNITGEAGVLTMTGNVGGNVDLVVDELNVLPGAHISGSLTYKSPKEVAIPSGTVVMDIDFVEKAMRKETRIDASSILWWLIRYLFILVIGLSALALFPNRTAAITRAIPDGSLRNLAVGFLVVVAGFAGSVILFITVIGIPLGIFLLFMTSAVLYTARLFFGLWLGKVIFSRMGRESKPWMALSLGLFILFIFTSLPWFGFLIYLLVTFIAIGGLFSEEKRFYTELREKEML